MVAKTSFSFGFKLYKIVFVNWSFSSKRPKNLDKLCAWDQSPIESQPVSGPKVRKARVLLFRIAPR